MKLTQDADLLQVALAAVRNSDARGVTVSPGDFKKMKREAEDGSGYTIEDVGNHWFKVSSGHDEMVVEMDPSEPDYNWTV